MLANDERPLLFDPKGPERPLFFLHIPKTAGSSNNVFLTRLFGEDRCQAHIENLLPSLLDGTRPPLEEVCLSGHVPLWAWTLYRGSESFDRVTLLRDPWARLVSHINWVNQFNHGMRLPRHGPGAPALARVVALMAETDFEDRQSLHTFFDAVNEEHYMSSFDNYQVRMLRTGRMDAMEKEVDAMDVDVACSELSEFAHFGFCEDQRGFQEGLLTLRKGDLALAEPVTANAGRHKALGADNDLAREVFAPWIAADQELIRFAYGLQGLRLAA